MQATELAGCVIYNEHGELLLLHRSTPNLVQWELPGGKLEKGETVHQAATRECREELGVDVELDEVIGSASFEQSGNLYSYTWLLAKIPSGKKAVIAEPNTFDTIGYCSLGDLHSMTNELSPNLINLLNVIE